MAWLHAVIDVPDHQHPAAAAFWGSVLGWPLGRPWSGHEELQSFEPPCGSAYLHLQRVHDAPAGVHIELESAVPDETVSRALELGATAGGDRDRWQTLRSPGGLPFCVLRAAAHEPPEATTWPDGHRTRMVQVCIDSPAATHDREVEFWRNLLPGRWVESDAPEFAGKWHDAGSPLQLLFQRLDEPDGVVRAHLDHGADDMAAEVARMSGLGAEDVGPGPGWHTFRDPTGLPFCITGNRPTGTLCRDLG